MSDQCPVRLPGIVKVARTDEYRFSVGNARPSVVSQRFVDYCSQILDFETSTMTDAALFAEVLLYSRTEKMLNDVPMVTETHVVPVYKELEDWQASWKHVLGSCGFLIASIKHSLMIAVPPTYSKPDFSYDFCYLLLYRTALKANSDSTPVQEAITQTTSKILERFLNLDFSAALEMPDFFFFIVIYAALNLCKFAVGHHLIAATQQYLTDIAPNDEHIAYRFGAIIGELRRAAAEAGVSLSDNIEAEKAFIAAQLIATEDGYTWQMLTTGNLANLDFCLDDITFPTEDLLVHEP